MVRSKRTDELFVGAFQISKIVTQIIEYASTVNEDTLTAEQWTDMIDLEPIVFKFPDGYDSDVAFKAGIVYAKVYPGYQHMISFWWKHVFELPVMQQYRYYMRMDSDFFI